MSTVGSPKPVPAGGTARTIFPRPDVDLYATALIESMRPVHSAGSEATA
jgi:hypothetical protein